MLALVGRPDLYSRRKLPRLILRETVLKSSMANMMRRKLTVVNDECRPGSLRWPAESTGCAAIGRQCGKCNSFAYETP
jgi:hypothetical protein